MHFQKNIRFAFIGLVLVSTFVPEAFAQTTRAALSHDVVSKTSLPKESERSVIVSVRAIKASRYLAKEDEKFSQEIVADEELSDLKSKLEGLEYKKYAVLNSKDASIPLLKKTNVDLSEKTYLTLRPLYIADQRVGMWIKWIDKSSKQVLLDSRMHFTQGETVLAGTDSKDKCALILAISARRMQ